MASQGKLREWFHKDMSEYPEQMRLTHMMIVRSDGVEADYPVYVNWKGLSPNDRKREIVDFEDKFHTVIEVYDLNKGFDRQLSKSSAWEIFND